MKRNNLINSGLWHGILWALFTSILAFIVLFLSGYALSQIKLLNADTNEIIAYLIYDLSIGIGCYFICRKYPDSIFIVPVLANTMGIISSVIEPNFWKSSLWVFILSGWIFSTAVSWAAYLNAKRIINNKETENYEKIRST